MIYNALRIFADYCGNLWQINLRVMKNVVYLCYNNNNLKTYHMNTTTETKKITLATVKSFIKKNADNLFVKMESSFNGMVDGVEFDKNAQFVPATKTEHNLKCTLGINGIFIAHWNSYTPFENDTLIGYEIYNCCGTTLIAAKK